ncbi:hypothetical protein SDC9_169653 [bioreactor metagenome]|uniref:Lipoprotein n=1 Tax=bioreactor metagenome TaxID=1076179 RepID=A0A645G8F1_9ZZZZ|nr:hypothetical protein [Lachnospiraceae bacterium]
MKKIFTVLISAMLCLSLCSCYKTPETTENKEALTENSENESKNDESKTNENEITQTSIEIKPSDAISQNCPNLYSSIIFQLEGEESYVKIFTSAEKDSSGNFLFDDSNKFFISTSIGENSYVLLEEENIQLGRPKINVFEDSNGALHIILSDIRTAQYNVYEFVYDSKDQILNKTTVMENAGINYWGEI